MKTNPIQDLNIYKEVETSNNPSARLAPRRQGFDPQRSRVCIFMKKLKPFINAGEVIQTPTKRPAFIKACTYSKAMTSLC